MMGNTLLVYILVVSVLMYIIILGPSRYHRDGLVGKAHILLAKAPRVITVALATILLCSRKRGDAVAAKLEHYLFDRKHPLMQIAYLIMTGGAIVVYFWSVFNDFLNSGVSRFHIISGPGVTLFSLLCYVKACYSDPGIITSETIDVDKKIFNHDGSLYIAGNDCKTCKFEKPARSKHCRLCDHCVRKFDHHCGWLNNDVGEDNLYWFYLFMVSHIVLCSYGTWTCFHLLTHICDVTGVWRGRFVNSLGEQYPATWYTVSQYMIQKNTAACGELLFMGCVTVMMTVFFFYNLYYTAKNMTTNETFKLSDLKDHHAWYATQSEKYNHYLEIHGAEKLADISPPEKPPPLPDLSKGWIYDKGFYNNIRTVWHSERAQVLEKNKRTQSKKASLLNKKKKRQ
eukprot:TRINITY_DN34419_c0_g1_i1.p1 TRINITY_DN34419_c0_g1~~TRINITY_DN34419_c0_g1_i1.p1  ORF type:complete len:398 (+),score=26.47 TRINITY_DN34419_c0_g1_i1:89-1282(+)